MVSPFVATHYSSYLPQPYIRQLKLNLIFGKIIWMSIQHMLIDQNVSMITFIHHEAFSRFGCVFGALQWLSLKKGSIMTNDVFHHFCHLHVNYKVLVMKEKKCWPNNVCTNKGMALKNINLCNMDEYQTFHVANSLLLALRPNTRSCCISNEI
jgi:hypothetical protein